MYSLVNIATVVRDLAQHPRAAQVTHELLLGFALDEDAAAALDDAAGAGDDATLLRAEVLAAERARAHAGRATDRGHVEMLERTALGGVDDLVRFVRRDVVAGAWETAGALSVVRLPAALDAVTDGVLSAVSGDFRLGAPWRRWTHARGLQVAPTGWLEIVQAVASLPRPTSWPLPPAEWATLMHDACWAVHLTGRERVAAVTQLHALRALLASYLPQAPPPRAVATTVAAVHAHVVADVLDTGTHLTMTAPLFRLLA